MVTFLFSILGNLPRVVKGRVVVIDAKPKPAFSIVNYHRKKTCPIKIFIRKHFSDFRHTTTNFSIGTKTSNRRYKKDKPTFLRFVPNISIIKSFHKNEKEM